MKANYRADLDARTILIVSIGDIAHAIVEPNPVRRTKAADVAFPVIENQRARWSYWTEISNGATIVAEKAM